MSTLGMHLSVRMLWACSNRTFPSMPSAVDFVYTAQVYFLLQAALTFDSILSLRTSAISIRLSSLS